MHAPQRVLGERLDADALDLGVGELELHALERRQALAELLARGLPLREPVNSYTVNDALSSRLHQLTPRTARYLGGAFKDGDFFLAGECAKPAGASGGR